MSTQLSNVSPAGLRVAPRSFLPPSLATDHPRPPSNPGRRQKRVAGQKGNLAKFKLLPPNRGLCFATRVRLGAGGS